MSIFPDLLFEGASIAKLVEEVKVVDSLQNLNEGDDMWVSNLIQYLNLIEGALF